MPFSFGDIAVKLKYHSRQTVMCKKCNKKTGGDLFVDETNSMDAVGGGKAHPYIWFCDKDRTHQRKPGWTKPVDFTPLASGDPTTFVSDLPGVDASEDDWQDWAYQKVSGMTPEALVQASEIALKLRNINTDFIV